MAKKFNVTGLCLPNRHYSADVSGKLAATMKMIDEGEYFIINRPRQYGKTTTMHTLRRQLIEMGYAVFHISFETVADSIFQSEEKLSAGFLRLLGRIAHESVPELKPFLETAALQNLNLEGLGETITDLCSQTDKRVVVFIDEVDQSSNNELFVRFLALLRDKYLERDRNPTFHSVMLAGLHDVKTLKLKINPNSTGSYNSPWNIATDYKVDMNLFPHEVKPMLDDYAQAEGVSMDSQAIAEQLFFYTSGYPFLTSYLCKIIAEDILPKKIVKEWTNDDVFRAFRMLMETPNVTNFDSLFKHLREYTDLYKLVFELVIDGEEYDYSSYDERINLGIMHGIFGKSETGKLKIHNRIYRELIADVMISEWRTSRKDNHEKIKGSLNGTDKYRLPNNGLDMKALVEGFQEFMRQNYSAKDRDFLERNGRLIFLAYLKPILNGGGFDFKEPQASEEKRLDLVITYFQHRYLIELKIWHGDKAHEKGIHQLADYLDRLGLDTGYLVIFDHNKKKTWTKDWAEAKGKRLYWVKC
jgi:AAA-like domain